MTNQNQKLESSRYNLYFSKCNGFSVFWSYRRWCILCGGYRYKHRISCSKCNSEDKY